MRLDFSRRIGYFFADKMPPPLRTFLRLIVANSLPMGTLTVRTSPNSVVRVENWGLPAGVSAGRHSYGTVRLFAHDEKASLVIGKFTSIASVSVVLGGRHHHTDVSTYPFKQHYLGAVEDGTEALGVRIGNDVWIGTDAFVLDGVTIGDGAVIGARSVVSRDIPPYAIAAGDPAEVKRFRFTQEEIAMLTTTQWWDLPESFIKENVSLFYSPDVKDFVSKLAAALKEAARTPEEALRED